MDSPERQDARAGKICATVANFAGKVLKDGHTTAPDDFFPSLRGEDPEPVLLDDPEAQSLLIMSRVFGIRPEQAYKH